MKNEEKILKNRIPQLEREIEKKLLKVVKENGGMSIKLAVTGVVGMPDRIVLLPNAHLIFVEVKAKGKKPRVMQEVQHRRLKALGFKVVVLDDELKIRRMIDELYTT